MKKDTTELFNIVFLWIFVTSAIGILIYMLITAPNPRPMQPITSIIIEKTNYDHITPTKKHVWAAIQLLDLKEPEIVMAQCILESNHFRSNVFLTKNNLLGFRNTDYLFFTHWINCLAYYKRYQEKYYRGVNYFEFLRKMNWCSDKEYEKKVRGI